MDPLRQSHAKFRKMIGLTAPLAVGLLLSSSLGGTSGLAPSTPLRLLIVTGGHDFEEAAFFRVFDEMNGITWTHASFGHGAEQKLTLEDSGTYDVAVFYDMHQDHEPHYREWLQVLERGKPTVFLHH